MSLEGRVCEFADREAGVQAIPAANDSNLHDTGPTSSPPQTAAVAELLRLLIGQSGRCPEELDWAATCRLPVAQLHVVLNDTQWASLQDKGGQEPVWDRRRCTGDQCAP